jgi:hypothetical protein
VVACRDNGTATASGTINHAIPKKSRPFGSVKRPCIFFFFFPKPVSTQNQGKKEIKEIIKIKN